MIDTVETDEVIIADYWLSAYVMASGCRLLGTKKSDDGWVVFCFGREALNAIQRWNQNRAQVDAKAYRSVIRKIRSIIFSNVEQ